MQEKRRQSELRTLHMLDQLDNKHGSRLDQLNNKYEGLINAIWSSKVCNDDIQKVDAGTKVA